MTTYAPRPTAPAEVRVISGTAGRWYVLDGHKVVATRYSAADAADALTSYTEDAADLWDDYGPEVTWFCDHDVPNGCHSCATARAASDWYDRQAAMAAEAAATLDPKFHPYLDLHTSWGDANEMAMHAMEAWADRNRP